MTNVITVIEEISKTTMKPLVIWQNMCFDLTPAAILPNTCCSPPHTFMSFRRRRELFASSTIPWQERTGSSVKCLFEPQPGWETARQVRYEPAEVACVT